MKKYIIILFITITQVGFSQWGVRIGPSVSYGISRLNFKDFNTFTNSYNEYIRQLDSYQEDLKPLRLAPTFSYGANILLGPYHAEVNFGRSTTRRTVDFKFNESRKFAFKRNYFSVYQGISYHDEYMLYGLGIGIHLVNAQLKMSYVYASGHESFGEERVLNGVYNNLVTRGSIGGRAGFFLGEQFGVLLKVDWYVGTTKGLFPAKDLTDLSWGTINNGTTNNWQELPKEYDPAKPRSLPDDDNVKGNWGEISVKLSLTWLINIAH